MLVEQKHFQPAQRTRRIDVILDWQGFNGIASGPHVECEANVKVLRIGPMRKEDWDGAYVSISQVIMVRKLQKG
jgi:hypothetical protein